ncbi:MAG: outer membrane protein assembly factor BamA [Planctomycetota bacterium]|nr:MAG: outer membrane protein assembly factor BamA [Planctomycetota bacterium]
MSASALWILAALAAAQEPGRFELRFEGNQSFGERELRRAAVNDLADLERLGYRRVFVDDAAFAMETYYRSQGFPFAVVEWREEPGTGVPTAVFQVEEGPRTLLEDIAVEGNTFLSDTQIHAFLRSEEDWLSRYFIASRVYGAPAAIRAAYRAEGWQEVQVERPEVELSADRSAARVSLRITEGVQYRIMQVNVPASEHVPARERERLVEEFRGRPYLPRRAFELQARLQHLYAEAGYAQSSVRVETAAGPAPGEVVLDATVEAGPRVRIGRILVQGNDDTRGGFIRSRVQLQEGEIYSSEAETESFRALYRTGLFRRVDLRLQGEGEVQDVVVEVEEAPSREIEFAPGYGSYEQLRAEMAFRDHNLFGSGKTGALELGASFVGETAELRYTDPWFLGSDLQFDLPFYHRRREEPSFTRNENGFSLLLTQQWQTHLTVAGGYTLRYSDVSDVDVTAQAQDLDEDVRIGSLSTETRHDTRNDLFNPNAGHLGTLRIEYGDQALGGQLGFARVEAAYSRYQELWDGTVVAASVRTGVITPLHDTDQIPLQERFFNGGENTVRSFEESELGPKDAFGEPVGGEVINVLNLELRQRLAGNLYGATFFDYGNVGLEFENYFDDFRSGVGVGVRYLLPVGAVRLDAAWNPDPRPDEEGFQLHLTVGMVF